MMGLISVIGSILGNGDVVSKGMDLIDDAFESDEEKRESKTKAKIDLMKAYAPFKVAQRWIAIIFTINFFVAFWTVVTLWALDKDVEGFMSIFASFQIGWTMLAIVTFYFGGGLTESIGRAKSK
jgi:hypothetical protein|tara:strand:+ start:35 stop:406 length:372 start_codon:yes stop_codon:yes gene_type:complete